MLFESFLIGDPDDNLSKSKNFEIDNIIVENAKKTKFSQKLKSKMGLEYDPQILKDNQLCEKILITNNYEPSKQKLLDFYEDISRLLVIFGYNNSY